MRVNSDHYNYQEHNPRFTVRSSAVARRHGMTLRIEDYAIVGDTETVALVGNNGSIDWLCFPRFDSAACFAALLGDENNGRWLIAPAVATTRVGRRYRPGTLVLETDFETPEQNDVGLLSEEYDP